MENENQDLTAPTSEALQTEINDLLDDTPQPDEYIDPTLDTPTAATTTTEAATAATQGQPETPVQAVAQSTTVTTASPGQVAAPAAAQVATPLEQAEATITQLRQTMAELMAASGITPAPVMPVAQPAQQPAPAKPIQLSSFGAVNDVITKLKTSQDFLSPEQLDQLVDKPELVNVAINSAVGNVVDSFVSIIPAIAASVANQQIILSTMAKDFYDANADLVPYKDFVATVAKVIEKENPEGTFQDIFSKTAERVREKLALKPTVAAAPGVKPAFAGGRNSARPAAQPAKGPLDMGAQIADLLS